MAGTKKHMLTRCFSMPSRISAGWKRSISSRVAPWYSMGWMNMPLACVMGPHSISTSPGVACMRPMITLRSDAMRLPTVCIAALSLPVEPEV
jgi:hypothetical protein